MIEEIKCALCEISFERGLSDAEECFLCRWRGKMKKVHSSAIRFQVDA